MNINLNENILEKEIKKVFKKLPFICSDTSSIVFIINALDESFEALTERHISID